MPECEFQGRVFFQPLDSNSNAREKCGLHLVNWKKDSSHPSHEREGFVAVRHFDYLNDSGGQAQSPF